MTGQQEATAEERRAALVERVAEAIRCVFIPNPDGRDVAPFAVYAASAEAVLALLSSGDAGVHLVTGRDLQESVGVVLGQLHEALAEVERLTGELARAREATARSGHELSSQMQEALREIGRLTSGADFSEPTPGVERSPEQVYALLLSLPCPERIAVLRGLMDGARDGLRCFEMGHAGQLCALEGQAERWRGMAEAVVADGLVRCLNPRRGIGDAGRCGECAGCAMRTAVAEVAP